jgi:hypothetical protein
VQLWQDLFSDPSQWWDQRLEKVSKEAFHVLQVRAGVFMNNSVIEVVASQMSLWRIALQICMPNVGAWRIHGECSGRCSCMMCSCELP